MRPAAAGERHRLTVGGPRRTPVIQAQIPGLTDAEQGRDGEFDSLFDEVMAGDRICAGER
ncbi:MAG: hypothetical protein L0206_11775 [Actinobacteria bacterium]|nr:hypothetical protein [Actinomycetota bacterium]